MSIKASNPGKKSVFERSGFYVAFLFNDHYIIKKTKGDNEMKLLIKTGVYFFLSVFLSMTGCSGLQMKTSSLAYNARYMVMDGNLVESVGLLEKALSMTPGDVNANVLMAQVQYRLGKIDKAGKFALSAYVVDSRDFRAMGILGLVDLSKGRYRQGILRVGEAMKIFNGIEEVGGRLSVEPETILKEMAVDLKKYETVSKEKISFLASAFWAKIDWYEFDEEYRKWHFRSFYDIRPDGGGVPNS